MFRFHWNGPAGTADVWLGTFTFLYVDRRIARFLMNAMFASGGYPWTIIHVENRNEYFSALEKMDLEQDITPLAEFIRNEMNKKS